MRLAPLASLALLTGCAGPVAVETRVVRETVPIPVPCVKPTDIPIMPPRVGSQLTGDAVNDASVLAAYALRLRGALDTAISALKACQTTG